MNDKYETEKPLSAILADLLDHPHPRLTIGELSERFGGRAFGALLFIFGVACTLPLPPGATTIFGAPLLLLAPQLVIGARAPWLPRALRDRAVSVADLRKGLPRAIGWLRKLEAVSRPRFAVLFGPVGERAIGVVCTLLALVLILPIPLGNMLPALAVSLLSLSLVQRDGLMALAGYVLAVSSITILVVAFQVIMAMLRHVPALLTGA